MAAIAKTNTYYAKDRNAWRKWLDKNHESSTGVWLIYYKKESGKTRVPYADAVEEALCYGWIDSTVNPIDEDGYMQLFTPRKEKSGWSKLNKERIVRLVEQGLMTPAGMKKIETAKKNGSWEKLDGIEAFTIPDELKKAFKANKKAEQYFGTLSNTTRKMILHYISTAKRQETKDNRVAEMMSGLAESRLPDRYARVLKPKG